MTRILQIRRGTSAQNDNFTGMAGDETNTFGIGDYATPLIHTYIEDFVLHARLFSGSQAFWAPHKSTGIKTNLTANKWKLKITVYY